MANDSDLSPLVESIYEIVIAPERLEVLLDLWTSKLRSYAQGSQGYSLLIDPLLMTHVERAEYVMRAGTGRSEIKADPISQWIESVRGAAIAVSRSGQIVAYNAHADAALGLRSAGSIQNLNLEDGDCALLLKEIARKGLPGKSDGPQLLRLRRRQMESPLLIHIYDIEDGIEGVAGLVISGVYWPEGLIKLVQGLFGLTDAETAVLEALTLGRTAKEIAAQTGRSEATLRSHISALLIKTQTQSQVELIRMTLALHFGVLDAPAKGQSSGAAPRAQTCRIRYEALTLPDGRILQYRIAGDPAGRPVLLMPSTMGLTRLPDRSEASLLRRRIKMVIPVRAGFGTSSALPAGRCVLDVTARDTFHLLDHLGIASLPFLTLSDDFRLAIAVSAFAPSRVSHVFGIGASFPTSHPDHLARKAKFSRFVSANARYAPRALPYVAQLFFGLCRKVGKKRFLQIVMANSPPDVRATEDPEIMDALIEGSEVTLSATHSAHAAWAVEVLAVFGSDWSGELYSCGVPITIFAGTEDPFSPVQTAREFTSRMANARLIEFAGTGLLMYGQFENIFDEVEASMQRGGALPAAN